MYWLTKQLKGWIAFPASLIGAILLATVALASAPLTISNSAIRALEPSSDTAESLNEIYSGETVYYQTTVPTDISRDTRETHHVTYTWYSGDKVELMFGQDRQFTTGSTTWWALVHPGHFLPGPHTVEIRIDEQLLDARKFEVHPEKRVTEQNIRDQIVADGLAWLNKGDTDSFERSGNQFRQSKERTPAGIWKLSVLYSCIKKLNIASGPDPRWASLENMAEGWLTAKPDSPTAVVVNAKLLFAHAWAYRGADARPADSHGYQEYLHRTLQLLEAHPEVATQDPEWDVLRVSVAKSLGVGPKEVFRLAAEALDRESNYYGLHYAAVDGLTSAWGGSEEWIKKYVDLAVGKSNISQGTQAYMRIYLDRAIKARDVLDELNLDGAKLDRTVRSFQEVIHAYPDPYNREAARALACFAGAAAPYRVLGRRGKDEVPPLAWWDVPQWRRSCDEFAFDGKTPNFSFSTAIHQHLSFLMGLGRDYWQPIATYAFIFWLLLESIMWILVRRGRISTVSNLISREGPTKFDPSLYPRSYRVAWKTAIWSERLVVRLGALSIAAAWAIQTVPWVFPQFTGAVFATLILVAILATTVVVKRTTARVVLSADAIEFRDLIRLRRMDRSDIAGRSAMPSVTSSSSRLLLFPLLQGNPPLQISPVQEPDSAFWEWFSSIPIMTNAPAIDRTRLEPDR